MPPSGRLQPGAEDGVDDQRTLEISEKCSSQRLLVGDLDDGHAEAAQDVEVGARVAADVGDRADDEHRGVDAALQQRARDDEAVAAVVAAPAEHRHAASSCASYAASIAATT